MARVRVNRAAMAEIARSPSVKRKLKKRAEQVAEAARSRAATHIGDASYLQSIDVHDIPEGWRVLADDEQAAAIEYGVRAHTITAAPGKLLWWPGLLHPVKTVEHPGFPAFHVMGNAADAARRG